MVSEASKAVEVTMAIREKIEVWLFAAIMVVGLPGLIIASQLAA